MASFNIYLRDKKNLNKETPLTLIIRDKSHDPIKIPTEKKIEPKYWNTKKQTAKDNYDNCEEFNEAFTNLKKDIKKAYELIIAEKSELSSETVKQKYLLFQTQNILKENQSINGQQNSLNTESASTEPTKDFYEYFKEFIKYSKEIEGKKYRTIQAYTSTRDHIKVYSLKKKVKIEFDKIDINFIKRFRRYLLDDHIQLTEYDWDNNKILEPPKVKKIGLTDAAISKDIKVLKTFSIWMFENGIINKAYYKAFKVDDIDSDIIVLSKEELQTLSKLELSEDLQLALDIFLVGSTVGLRISDLLNISPHKVFIDKKNLKNSYLTRKTYKTNKDVQLPLLPFVAKIFLKYQGIYETALPTITEYKLNKAIKQIGKLAGFTDLVEKIYLKDGKQVVEIKPKYEFMSSHMCRRNFICLLIKAGETAEVVMDLSGHLDYKSFRKYLKFYDNDRFKVIQRSLGDLYE